MNRRSFLRILGLAPAVAAMPAVAAVAPASWSLNVAQWPNVMGVVRTSPPIFAGGYIKTGDLEYLEATIGPVAGDLDIGFFKLRPLTPPNGWLPDV